MPWRSAGKEAKRHDVLEKKAQTEEGPDEGKRRGLQGDLTDGDGWPRRGPLRHPVRLQTHLASDLYGIATSVKSRFKSLTRPPPSRASPHEVAGTQPARSPPPPRALETAAPHLRRGCE